MGKRSGNRRVRIALDNPLRSRPPQHFTAVNRANGPTPTTRRSDESNIEEIIERFTADSPPGLCRRRRAGLGLRQRLTRRRWRSRWRGRNSSIERNCKPYGGSECCRSPKDTMVKITFVFGEELTSSRLREIPSDRLPAEDGWKQETSPLWMMNRESTVSFLAGEKGRMQYRAYCILDCIGMEHLTNPIDHPGRLSFNPDVTGEEAPRTRGTSSLLLSRTHAAGGLYITAVGIRARAATPPPIRSQRQRVIARLEIRMRRQVAVHRRLVGKHVLAACAIVLHRQPALDRSALSLAWMSSPISFIFSCDGRWPEPYDSRPE